MSNLYTAHLWDARQSGAGSQSSPPPPTGYLWVIRNIQVSIQNNATGKLILTDDSTGNLYLLWSATSPGTAGEAWQWTGRAVLEPPNFLDLVVETAGDWTVWVDGYVLSTT